MSGHQARLLHPADLRAQIAHDLGIQSEPVSTGVVLAQSLRRLCGLLCPAPRELIVERAVQSLDVMLEVDQAELKEIIHETIEALILAGDLAEVTDTQSDCQSRTSLYLCAPRFMRLGDRCYVLGIATDDARFLPDDISAELIYEGAVRYLPYMMPVDDIERLGLREISPKHWSRKLPYGDPEVIRETMEERLRIRGTDGDPGDIRLLSHTGLSMRYQERWRAPTDESGYYVFRVERAFGAAAWFVGVFSVGRCMRYLAIDPIEPGGRACDAAWLLQLAIDATNGHANTYELKANDGRVTIRPNFPLPNQVRRQLSLLAGRIPSMGAPQEVLSFAPDVVDEAEAILQHACWFVRR